MKKQLYFHFFIFLIGSYEINDYTGLKKNTKE
jgi:hypothetical protein